MRFVAVVTVALAADAAVASTWFGKAIYNKWHETELERWLADHGVPHTTAADRKELENLVKEHWQTNVAQPYNNWSPSQLQSYLTSKGDKTKEKAAKSKDSLLSQVMASWTETEEQASSSYGSVKEWIFESWSETQLKSFLDRHGIPNPQPRTRDSLLKTVRENYQAVADKTGQNAFYPGNWLYEKWSEADLKAWLDERGVPVPQPTSRDKLIATVRRNSRYASKTAAKVASSASASAASAQASLSDTVFNAWSDSQLKEFFDKNDIKVPQGSRRNELLALARKNKARLTGDTVSGTAASAYGAATSSVGSQYARATDGAGFGVAQVYDSAYEYYDWACYQLGFYGAGPEASASRASASASRSAASIASFASKSASSVYSKAIDAAHKATGKAKQEL